MEKSIFQGCRLYTLNTVVVGSGAAGYNTADELWNKGQRDIAIVTEHVLSGTSRNTGSDKQTYYKLSLGGRQPDSVGEMAETLFAGKCVDGEHALCEAALSAPCFLKLAGLGVPFPQNRYGEYAGYKTDHDPRRRATSVGPYTSKKMTEVLEGSVRQKNITVLDGMQAICILSDKERCYGLLCLDIHAKEETDRFVFFRCRNLVMATGGPAGMYRDSVYPPGHYGATGIMFAAGAKGKNLTEWQYGLASVKPRWNVSGTYMQAIPRIYSADADGENENEFLEDFFEDRSEMLSRIFMKGYQWPLDVRKVENGSSIIDILVYMEREKGRRIFLDFRENPGKTPVDFDMLTKEAGEYLKKAGACLETPFERLFQMNAPAALFYWEKGVDLSRQPLEIALCAQHNNGGISIDAWWQTNLKGLFCVGEAAASHGVYRPGGSALNAGQVGSTRAASYIAARCGEAPSEEKFFELAGTALLQAADTAQKSLSRGKEENIKELWSQASSNMSLFGAAIREKTTLKKSRDDAKKMLEEMETKGSAMGVSELPALFRLRTMLLSQYVYLSSMLAYLEHGGKSRGSALYTDADGRKPYENLPEKFRFILEAEDEQPLIQEVVYEDGACRFTWRSAHPIPEEEDFFENVWREYRKNGNIY